MPPRFHKSIKIFPSKVFTFKAPMLFCIGFIAFFTIGVLSEVLSSAVPFDLQVTGTYFIVARIQYVLFAGSVMGLYAAFYYWFPKFFGKMYNENLGQLHFWITTLCMNFAFFPVLFPMHFVGRQDLPRRVAYYAPFPEQTNQFISISVFVLGLAQLLVMVNVHWSIKFGKEVAK